MPRARTACPSVFGGASGGGGGAGGDVLTELSWLQRGRTFFVWHRGIEEFSLLGFGILESLSYTGNARSTGENLGFPILWFWRCFPGFPTLLELLLVRLSRMREIF